MKIVSPLLQPLNQISHGFFTRRGGVSGGAFASLNCGWGSGDDIDKAMENRRRVATHLDVSVDNLMTCYQIHSPDVVTVTMPWCNDDSKPRADAMVTDRTGIALGILTADCAPVLLVDPQANIIGAAHAGWRGALGGILENTVDAMTALGAKPENIRAAIGACIWQNSYEVGAEFPEHFVAQDASYKMFFCPAERDGHFMFDLPGFVRHRLEQAGVAAVAPSPADTFADEDRFFSYRRMTLAGETKNGRLIAAISLRQS